jgi:hypothetical protein
MQQQKYIVNSFLTGIIQVPFMVRSQQDCGEAGDTVLAERIEAQVDCAIASIVKELRRVPCDDLKQKVEARLEHPIENKMFEARLKSLERKFVVGIEAFDVIYLE